LAGSSWFLSSCNSLGRPCPAKKFEKLSRQRPTSLYLVSDAHRND
jgi:hypothetical protein